MLYVLIFFQQASSTLVTDYLQTLSILKGEEKTNGGRGGVLKSGIRTKGEERVDKEKWRGERRDGQTDRQTDGQTDRRGETEGYSNTHSSKIPLDSDVCTVEPAGMVCLPNPAFTWDVAYPLLATAANYEVRQHLFTCYFTYSVLVTTANLKYVNICSHGLFRTLSQQQRPIVNCVIICSHGLVRTLSQQQRPI